jgi:hemerythrin-like domain-containing protein
MVDALKNLLDEHVTIVTAVQLLSGAVRRMQDRKEMPQEFFGKVLHILRDFVDGCHHAKEEEALFPMICKEGAEQSNIVSMLIDEHAKGREFVRAMRGSLDSGDIAGMARNASGYSTLLMQHIKRENLIFPQWIDALQDKARKELSERFDSIEGRSIGLGKRLEYVQMIEKLKKEMQAAGTGHNR